MTIEPMGSSVSVQTTSVRKAEINPVSKPVEFAEVNSSQQAVDKATIVVSDVQEHGKNKITTEQEQQQQNARVRKAVEKMNQNMKH